jgi:curved DNA-binding protein
MARDYYEVLGVSRGASDREIKRAYRQLVKKLHPDRNGDDPEALARFKEVSEAYEVLGDAERRALYEQCGVGGGAGGFSFDFEAVMGGVNAGFQTSFEEIFGGRTRRRKKRRHLSVTVQVGMLEALRGCDQDVSYRSDSGRSGRVRVSIPPGSRSGDNLRVRSSNGRGRPEDVKVRVEVVPHPCLRWEGDAVVMDLPLTCLEAYRGGPVSVETPGGTVRVKIPPGSRTGQKLRLRGKGPKRRGERVDLMLRLVVELPNGKDAAVEKALEQVEAAYECCPRNKLPKLH